MDSQRDVLEEHPSYDSDLSRGDVVVRQDEWYVVDLVLTQEKLGWMWQQVLSHPALRLQYGSMGQARFYELLTEPSTMFYELWKDGQDIPSGVVYFTNMMSLQDVEVHVFFYDSALANKVSVGRELMRWLFKTYHVHRISTTIPRPYGATIRFTFKMGFKLEGTLRQAALVKGHWHDILMFGLLPTDLED